MKSEPDRGIEPRSPEYETGILPLALIGRSWSSPGSCPDHLGRSGPFLQLRVRDREESRGIEPHTFRYTPVSNRGQSANVCYTLQRVPFACSRGTGDRSRRASTVPFDPASCMPGPVESLSRQRDLNPRAPAYEAGPTSSLVASLEREVDVRHRIIGV